MSRGSDLEALNNIIDELESVRDRVKADIYTEKDSEKLNDLRLRLGDVDNSIYDKVVKDGDSVE